MYSSFGKLDVQLGTKRFCAHYDCFFDFVLQIWDTIKGHVQTDFANIVSTDETDLFSKPEGGHLSVDYTCMKWLSLVKKVYF